MSDEYSDDGDCGGPTSHRYLYRMDREELFAMFVGAVAPLKVDDDGAHCGSYEAPSLMRMARAVQERADSSIPREEKLGTVACVLRVLLSRTDGRDRGEDDYYHMPLPDLAAYFRQVRAELGDMLVLGTWQKPVAVPDDIAELGSTPQVRADADGRLWTDLDAGDEVSEGEDIATVEGGYIWHTDGRPPEPLA
ncbi:hypothetical protein [Mycobacterium aquaticum]|uniref:Uncharacterized protein n=1 Tax=Mycobacterium aquaticum TaxID=1927124 RepID=A0A1X0ANA4_9MYCO|nr:hypothetical protein [Mycobacterium aquaticum]ORA31567.1 hypothetical protein BST13_24735 [Mycobacterium aquaticum]